MPYDSPLVLLAPPQRDPRVGQPWGQSGPACVYDGVGLENEPTSSTVAVPCPHCAQPMPIAWSELLRLPSLQSQELAPWLQELLAAFGLAPRTEGPFCTVKDALGLPAHMLVGQCQACATAVVTVWGLGEFQPGRQVVNLVGAAAVRVAAAFVPVMEVKG